MKINHLSKSYLNRYVKDVIGKINADRITALSLLEGAKTRLDTIPNTEETTFAYINTLGEVTKLLKQIQGINETFIKALGVIEPFAKLDVKDPAAFKTKDQKKSTGKSMFEQLVESARNDDGEEEKDEQS